MAPSKTSRRSTGSTRSGFRTGGGAAALAGIPGVEALNDYGQMQEVRVDDAQRFLAALAARTTVQHFEIARPSLHDIFVRIARPSDDHAAAPSSPTTPGTDRS